MLAESQFCDILILTMSNSDGKDPKLENSPAPTSIPPYGSPIIGPISISPKLENQVSVSRSTEEVKKRRRSGDETDEGLKNSSIPTSITSTGSPILASIPNTPKLENQVSVSRSAEEELKKRRRLGDETDQRDEELKNSPIPTSIPPIGSPILASISNNPKSEIQVSVSRSTEEELKKRRRLGEETDQKDEELQIPPIPTSIAQTGSPILASISNNPKSEIQVSVSRSTEEELKKRWRLGEETDQKDEELLIPPIPTSIPPIGSPISESVSKTPKSENQVYVSLSTKEPTKRRRLGDEIDENDDGFKTPTDPDHRISVPAKCPPAPRKPSSRKSKSPPETASETRRSIFPVDVSDEEAESMFPPRVED